jgi:hypothetical protein
MTFGYDSHTFGKSAASLRDHAKALVNSLTEARANTEVRS